MNKLEQAARALLAKWDAHPYTPWREVGFISGDVANLREALAEQALQKLSDFHQMMEQEPDANNFATTEELMVALGKSPEESKRIHNDLKNLSIAEQAEQRSVAATPTTLAEPVTLVDCYQEAYDAMEAQLIKEPTGNGLDQLAQNNGLIISMNTLQKMNLAEQAEQEIIPSWEEYCECEGIPCETVKPVDLTDDEIYEVLKRYTKTERYKDDFGSYRAVIAADREKNK